MHPYHGPLSLLLQLFENIADGKAIGLTQPLLSTTQSSSFAFAKCHYETNVPHDPFAVQLLETEKFPRFARLWTRGYDVYTPSMNIVYRDNAILHPLHHTTGHGDEGERKWPKNDNERRDAHIRMKEGIAGHSPWDYQCRNGIPRRRARHRRENINRTCQLGNLRPRQTKNAQSIAGIYRHCSSGT